MDLSKAALLIAAVLGITEFTKAIGPANWFNSVNGKVNSRAAAITALVVGQTATFLVAATVWAHAEVLNGHPLDQINVASKVLVGLFVAGAAAFGDRVLNAVKNVGANQVNPPNAK